MKERPILFSAPMVRAILDGRKTQTRRIVKLPKERGVWEPSTIGGAGVTYSDGTPCPEMSCIWNTITGTSLICPCGLVGDRLWVRETFLQDTEGFIYRADGDFEGNAGILGGWRPSIHMPRSASRILLEIVNVRVERLQDISEKDAIAEGISRVPFRPDDGFPICDGYMVGKDDGVTSLENKASKAYRKLWESINGPGSWDLNPFVWVVEFKVLRTARAAA